MHDDIIRFSLEGEMSDSNIVQQKERLVHFLEVQMREDGAVPSLDLEPQFTLDYDPQKESYRFKLSVYGIYQGRSTACSIAGVTNGTTKERYTPLVK